MVVKKVPNHNPRASHFDEHASVNKQFCTFSLYCNTFILFCTCTSFQTTPSTAVSANRTLNQQTLSEMTTLEADSFDRFYERLLTSIQHSVQTLADETMSSFLLTAQELQQCLKGSLSDYEKADTLLHMVGTKIDVDATVLGQFIDILKNHATLDHLVEEIGKPSNFFGGVHSHLI